jgi:hypothetical protein
LSVSGTSTLTGDITAQKNLTVNSNLNVLSNLYLSSNLLVSGTSTLTGDITAQKNLTITSNLNANIIYENGITLSNIYLLASGGVISGNINITSNLTVNSNLNVLSNLYLSSNLSVSGTSTFNGIININSNIFINNSNNNDTIILSNSLSTSYANIKFNNNVNSNAIIGLGGSSYTGYYANNFFIQAQSNIILNANNTSNSNPHLFISTSGNIGIGTSISPPSINSCLNIYSSNQKSARITLTGTEFYSSGANTSNEGIAMFIGVNRNGNRQLWIGDTEKTISNNINAIIRIIPSSTPLIDAVATDGNTSLNFKIGTNTTFLANGTIGIGTNNTSSNDLLTLSNNNQYSNTNIKFINSSTSNSFIGIGGSNSMTLNSSYQNNFFIHSTCNIILNANNNSTPTNPHLFISTSGNIGIGTSQNLTYTLNVNGTIATNNNNIYAGTGTIYSTNFSGSGSNLSLINYNTSR